MSQIMNRQPHEIVGTADFTEVQHINKYGPQEDPHEYDGNALTGIEIPHFMPRSFNGADESKDNYYRALQSEMMDNGWYLEEDETSKNSESSISPAKYFTHPTYRGKMFRVYIHELSNGKLIMLPLVSQGDDPKGLGCSIHMETNGMFYEVRSNRWVSFYEDRKGKRRLQYNSYLSRREEKKKEHQKMVQGAQSKM